MYSDIETKRLDVKRLAEQSEFQVPLADWSMRRIGILLWSEILDLLARPTQPVLYQRQLP